MPGERFGQAVVDSVRARAAGYCDCVPVGIDDQQPNVGQRFGAQDVLVDGRNVAARQRSTDLVGDEPRLVGQIEDNPVVQATAHRGGCVQRRCGHANHGENGVRRRQPTAQRV